MADYTSIYPEQIYKYRHFNVPSGIVDKYPAFADFMRCLDEEFDQFHDFLDTFLLTYDPFETSSHFLIYLARELNFDINPEDVNEEARRATLAHVVEWFKRRATSWFFEYILKEFGVDATITYGRDKIGILSNHGELSGDNFYFHDNINIADGAIFIEIDSDVASILQTKLNADVPIGRAYFYTLRDRFSMFFKVLIHVGTADVIINCHGSEWTDSHFFGTLSDDRNTLSEYFFLSHSDDLWEDYGFNFDINFED